MRKIDGQVAIPLSELPPEMMDALVEAFTYALYKFVPDQEMKTEGSDMADAMEELYKKQRIPVVIASGDEINQRLDFKILDREVDTDVQVLVRNPDSLQ